jgi:aerobic-type carbon monoxide dehydrogenase small subunit (CoxS/CutS family)
MNLSINLTVNGMPRTVEFEDPRVTLLDLLRDRQRGVACDGHSGAPLSDRDR